MPDVYARVTEAPSAVLDGLMTHFGHIASMSVIGRLPAEGAAGGGASARGVSSSA